MKNWFFKLCSTILVLALFVNMLPMSIFAEEFKEHLTMQDNVSLEKIETEDLHVVSELADKRTQYTKEFLLSNGLHMATVYADPVHYEKDGKWAEIDNTLVAKSDGTLRNTAGAWNVSFPNQLSGNNSVSIEKDGYTLSFYMAGELRSSGELMVATMGTEATEPLAVSQMQIASASIQSIDTAALEVGYMYPEAAPKKLGSQLRYNDVYANTDVVYDLQSDMVKESIIIDAYSSTLRGYRYTLNVGQLIPVVDEWGDITFYAPDGETAIMTMPAPFLMDANNAYNDDIQVQLTGAGSTYTLTYLLPQQWLAEEERAWPVILDPVVKASRDKLAIRDQTVCEKKSISETKTVLDAGYSEERGIIRGYLKYLELPPLTSSDVIVQALFTLHKVQTNSTSKTVEVHKVTKPWPKESLTWANKPEFRPDISDFRYVKNEGLYSWTVTEIVRSWYTDENNGLMIKMSNDVESGGSDYFRQFYSSDTGKYNRPTLQVIFRNNNGLEGTWDYTSTSAGRAGTGSVNNFTGNLVWVRNDMGFGGNRMPVSIDHVYNANDAIVHPDAEGQINNANDSGGNYFGLGVGWRTNYHQRVFQWRCDDATGDSKYYIWEDGDGTDHYFKESGTNTYKNEEGLEMTLKTNLSGNNAFSITEKKGNTRYFDAQGRLTKIQNKQKVSSSIDIRYKSSTGYEIDYITDGAGRKYVFDYDNGLLSKIEYWGTKATAIHTTTFSYTGNQLTAITDNDGKSSLYAYNKDNILESVQDIDGYTVSYEYTRKDNTGATNTTDGTILWEPPYLVELVKTTDTDANNKTKEGGSLTFTYGYNETRMTDHTGNAHTLQFNDLGNLISIVDDEGHAQSAQYAANAHTDTGKANQLTLSSKLQNTVVNLLNHSSFEGGNVWTAADSGTTATVNTDPDNSHYGAKSLLVKGSVHAPAFTVAKGETYTLSVYVKANDAASIGFKVGGTENGTTAIPVGTEFVRYEVSYTNNTGNDIQIIPFLSAGSANGAYFDAVQLEKAPTASRYNLVENGDFRYTGDDSHWTLHDDCTSLDIYTAPTTDLEPAAPQLDETCFSITGNRTKTKNISQKIKVSGEKGDSFVFAGWAAGYAIPQGSVDGDTRRFAVRARFKYTDGKYSDYEYASFQPTIQDDKWQYTSKAIVAEKDYTEITIGVVYHHNVNTVYFDGIQLFKEEFGTSYVYDDNGNVISSVDLQKKNTTYEYSSDNDLTKILEDNKAKMKYTYDDYHNVTKAVTQKKNSSGKIVDGIVYKFTYDDFGNNTSVTVINGDNTITTSATYSADGNRMLTSTDDLANVTTYCYNVDTNMLEWVQYPNDTCPPDNTEGADGADSTAGTGGAEEPVDTRTKYTYDSMYRMQEAKATVDVNVPGILNNETLKATYTYIDDLLTAITTTSTTYNFTYGDFAQRSTIKVGNTIVASYEYTQKNNYLDKLTYGNGDFIRYEYDNKGRTTKEIYGYKDAEGNFVDEDTVAYKYDNNGSLATMTDSKTGVETTYYYDLLDRPLKYVETAAGYNHSVVYDYDKLNNLDKLVETVNNVEHTTDYTYDYENRLEKTDYGNFHETVSYDAYGRMSSTSVKNTVGTITQTTFGYRDGSGTAKSSQLASVTVSGTGNTNYLEYSYTHDRNGNITNYRVIAPESMGGISQWTDGKVLLEDVYYHYDTANQLVREDNVRLGTTTIWDYDDAGNILSVQKYPYTSEENDVAPNAKLSESTYAYGDSNWGDKLTAFNNVVWNYDTIGNLTNDGTWNYTWRKGRELESMSNGSVTWNYTYNSKGIRTSRSSSSATYNYVYHGDQLVQMTKGDDTFYFTYGAFGPNSVTWNGTTYYYAVNAQGDVTGIFDGAGNCVVTYSWDTAWGYNPTPSGSMASTLGTLNPLRYRGYVYDEETGLYYLQSRYYNPQICRFINADRYPSTGLGLLGNNMFIYCNNNPVALYDPNGEFGVFGLMAIGAVVSAGIEYASQVIKNYKNGATGAEAWVPSNYGKIASAAFSGAVSAIPGGGVLATAADVVGSAVIEQGVNCLVDGRSWEWSTFRSDVKNNVIGSVVSSKLKLSDDVPKYLRHIKDEAREIGIKGTRKLTKYLNIKQTLVIVKNSLNSDTVDELVSAAR